jgi:hypothetical protein
MRTASDFATRAAIPPARPRLAVVPDPAPVAPAPRRVRLAALLAGLSSGFVLAALAAATGGGDPGGALALAAASGTLLALVLAWSRHRVVRERRARRPRPVTAPADDAPASPRMLHAA